MFLYGQLTTSDGFKSNQPFSRETIPLMDVQYPLFSPSLRTCWVCGNIPTKHFSISRRGRIEVGEQTASDAIPSPSPFPFPQTPLLPPLHPPTPLPPSVCTCLSDTVKSVSCLSVCNRFVGGGGQCRLEDLMDVFVASLQSLSQTYSYQSSRFVKYVYSTRILSNRFLKLEFIFFISFWEICFV